MGPAELVDIASSKQVKRGGWELTNWPVMGELASATSDPAK
jgi:hypothetical protein